MKSEDVYLGELEQLLLLIVLRLGDDAYANPIAEELLASANRRIARGALYTALERLVRHEWLGSADEVRTSLRRHLRAGDVVMMKASKSIGFSKVVDDLIREFAPPVPGEPAPHAFGQGA